METRGHRSIKSSTQRSARSVVTQVTQDLGGQRARQVKKAKKKIGQAIFPIQSFTSQGQRKLARRALEDARSENFRQSPKVAQGLEVIEVIQFE